MLILHTRALLVPCLSTLAKIIYSTSAKYCHIHTEICINKSITSPVVMAGLIVKEQAELWAILKAVVHIPKFFNGLKE
jgi:hypothetical protein